MSTINELLPKTKREKAIPVQAMIPESLHDQVAAQKKADGVTWTQLIEACLKQYLEEKRPSGGSS